MPQYFFHVEDGLSMPDIVGKALPNIASAREEAVRLSCALLSENASLFWTGDPWRMEVHEDDRYLFSLTFCGRDAAPGRCDRSATRAAF